MGFLDTLLGRTKPVQPKLDDLFALPSAAVTLDAGAGFKPTGSGSVCFRPVEGRSFSDVEKDVQELLDMSSGKEGGLPVEVTKDSYGFNWLVSSRMSDELDALVTDLHAVNSSLVDAASARSCCAPWSPSPMTRSAGWPWSTCTSGARSTRSPRCPASAGTTRSNCRSRA